MSKQTDIKIAKLMKLLEKGLRELVEDTSDTSDTHSVTPVPFSNKKEMVNYVLNIYKSLDHNHERREQVEVAVKSFGVSNVNDIEPHQYSELKSLLDQI